MRKLIFICLMLCTCVSLSVQAKQDKKDKTEKQVAVKTLLKEARTAISKQNGQADHIKKLSTAYLREDLTLRDKKDITYTISQLYRSLNDSENMKAYLKQKYDTAAFFSSILKACEYAYRCDSLDALPNEKGRVVYNYRPKNRDMLLRYRANVYGGGRFYLRKNDYRSSLPYFELYYSLHQHPIFEGSKQDLAADTLLGKIALYSVVAAYESEKPERVLHYVDPALGAVTDDLKPLLEEYRVRSYEWLRDTAHYVSSLEEGCRLYPDHDYFFLELIEYHDSLHQYRQGIALADSMLQHVAKRPIYWYAKSLLNYHAGNWEDCIAASDSVLELESEHMGALYNKGVSQMTITTEFARTACYDYSLPECQRDRQIIMAGFESARKSFEALRPLMPDDKKKWAPYLYRIYLNLNMGKEFDEMEKILNES